MENNLDQPAVPSLHFHPKTKERLLSGEGYFMAGGFTKRERACIDLMVPESGDEELDALIIKGITRKYTWPPVTD